MEIIGCNLRGAAGRSNTFFLLMDTFFLFFKFYMGLLNHVMYKRSHILGESKSEICIKSQKTLKSSFLQLIG